MGAVNAGAQEMPSRRYDPFDRATIEDPYRWFEWLRANDPCHYVEERDVYAITRHADVLAVLRDPGTFSSAQGLGGHNAPRQRDLATTDPPEHGRLRRMVARYFAPRQMELVEARTAAIVEDILDRVIEAETVDWVDDVARPLPTYVIAYMLGIPFADAPLLGGWADAVVTLIDGEVEGEERARLEASREECKAYLGELIAARRRSPAENPHDVISVLLAIHDEGALNEREVLAFSLLLLVAGLETTMNANSNGLTALFANPEERRKAVHRPDLIPGLIEEILRYDAPIQTVSRVTTADAEVAGTKLPKGSRALLFFGSANRDEERFEEAGSFRVERGPKGHLAFGAGPHTCLGAPVTRMELRVLGEAVMRRVASIAPAGPAVRTDTLIARGFTSLPVTVVGR
jgi:cytochrome P450